MSVDLFKLAKDNSVVNNNVQTKHLVVTSCNSFIQKDSNDKQWDKIRLTTKDGIVLFCFANQVKNLPEFIDSNGIKAEISLKPDTYDDKDGNSIDTFRVVSVRFKPAVKVIAEMS